MALAANFIFIIGVVAVLSELLRTSNTSMVIDSTSNLLSSTIKAAKG